MKIRNGFVSNSSSSSFICDICGESETYYDGLSDVDAVRCKDDIHSYHLECAKKFDLVMVEDDYYGGESVTTETCPCCNLKILTKGDKLAFLIKKVGMSDVEILKQLQAERDLKQKG